MLMIVPIVPILVLYCYPVLHSASVAVVVVLPSANKVLPSASVVLAVVAAVAFSRAGSWDI